MLEIAKSWYKGNYFHILRALILLMLKSYIAIFSNTNTKKYAAMVEEKPKKLAVELQCTAKYGCAL